MSEHTWRICIDASQHHLSLPVETCRQIAPVALLVFPAYPQHSVDANASAEERISISFNIKFSSFTENLSKPLW